MGVGMSNLQKRVALDMGNISDHIIEKSHQVSINEVLEQRGKRYGEFKEHANITQSIKMQMQACEKWSALTHDKRESLEVIAHKIGRILNGDPEYKDSWVDIAGYSQLVADTLKD